ncbi:MAG: hypothetical protein LBG88_02885 [Christensenellaceae bacterium]|jgi:hypothetical protein|nr:hypothetical protein [Christensenellaceae bacterium]
MGYEENIERIYEQLCRNGYKSTNEITADAKLNNILNDVFELEALPQVVDAKTFTEVDGKIMFSGVTKLDSMQKFLTPNFRKREHDKPAPYWFIDDVRVAKQYAYAKTCENIITVKESPDFKLIDINNFSDLYCNGSKLKNSNINPNAKFKKKQEVVDFVILDKYGEADDHSDMYMALLHDYDSLSHTEWMKEKYPNEPQVHIIYRRKNLILTKSPKASNFIQEL